MRVTFPHSPTTCTCFVFLVNFGALVLKALFEHWPESHIYKEEQKLAEEKSKEPVDTGKY